MNVCYLLNPIMHRSEIFALANYNINNDMQICKKNTLIYTTNVCGYSTKLQFDLFVRSLYKAVAASLLA